jgi:hypothetical protein
VHVANGHFNKHKCSVVSFVMRRVKGHNINFLCLFETNRTPPQESANQKVVWFSVGPTLELGCAIRTTEYNIMTPPCLTGAKLPAEFLGRPLDASERMDN